MKKPMNSSLSGKVDIMHTSRMTTEFSKIIPFSFDVCLANYKHVDHWEGLGWSSNTSQKYLRLPWKRSKQQFVRQVYLVEDEQDTQFIPPEAEVEKFKVMQSPCNDIRIQEGPADSSLLAYDPDFIKMIGTLPLNNNIEVVPFIKAWLAEGKALTKEGVVAGMTKLRRWSRYSQALQISEWIATEKPFELDERDAICRIDLMAKSGDLDGAEKLFQELPPEYKTERAYNTLLAVYCYRNLVTKAEKLMDVMKESRLCSSPFAYNHLMSLYVRNGFLDKLSLLLEELKSTGITPDVYTYNILMGYKGKSGDIEAMEKLMGELRADSRAFPNGATYTVLANAYISAGMRDKAENVLREMEFALDAGHIKRRLLSYETLLTMYGTLGKLDGVERVWLHVKVYPQRTTASYVCMIEALGRMGEIERAEKIFQQRKKENKNIRNRLYNALLSGYSRKGLMWKADDLVKEMQGRGLALDSLSYYHLIRGYLNSNEDDKALEAFKEVKGIPGLRRPKLWYDTSLIILNIFSERGDVTNAKSHFEDCRRIYSDKDVRLYNYLLKAHIKAQMPIVDGFLDRMAADGIKPNKETEDLLKQLEHLP
ncbi:hypothetical protein O6H91_04G012500 [Diphasiastrum complanatum]|nr:hypothetical protein O6H91_Y100100 [Diphasiastrum complanatum]KAJ7557853.1 hypothetical protein O6H91_04G012500 [Diphasiastrum complanatum]